MRVLIAEDQDFIRMGLRKIVGELDGLSIDDAPDGRSAWASFQRLPADIVITDIVMPDMDGLELLERIHTVAPECCMIVMSGHDKFGYAQQAMRFGARDYLLKPIRREPLLERIEQCRRELRELRAQRAERVQLAWRAVMDGREQSALPLMQGVLPTMSRALLVALHARGADSPAEAELGLPLLFEVCALDDKTRLYTMRNATTLRCVAPPGTALYWEPIGEHPGEALISLARRMDDAQSQGQALARVVRYIDQHCEEDLTLEKLAGMVHLHPNYLSSLFKRRMGSGLSKYLQRARIEKSKPLLRGAGLKVYEVASMCGFNDEQYFSRVFKNLCGESPQEFRDHQRVNSSENPG